MLLYLGRCAVATVAVCGFGRWFGVSLRAATSNLPSSPDHPSEIKQTCAPAYKTVDFSQSNKFAVPRSRLPCRLFRLSVEPRLSTALKDRSVVPWSSRLSLCPSPLPRFQQRYLCTSRKMGESISTIQHSPRKSMSYKFAAPRYRLPPMALQTVQVSVEPRLSTATHKAEMALNDRSVVS